MGADKEKFKTEHNVFDDFTNRTLFKLISSGHFRGLESPISIGKESNVFSARKEDDSMVIVKIYRLESCDFNTMFQYIKNDPRYMNISRKKRNVIFSWVQREYRNLMLAREAGVSVPLAQTFLNNVLVLDFVGSGEEIAPKLKDKIPENPEKFLEKLIDNIKKMYKADLVHADLSSFNILNNDDEPVFIDMSQTTTLKHPQAIEFLERDVKNVCQFFKKHGVDCDVKEIVEKVRK